MCIRDRRIKVALAPTTYALNEVVVKPKRERYKKKNNPAVEFVRKMIEHRDDYSPDERDFWQRERYEKMTFAINNFDSVKPVSYTHLQSDGCKDAGRSSGRGAEQETG